MTKEEILAMEPGPELDTLVAEKVMNHPMPAFIPEDALDLCLVGTPIHYDSWTCVCCYDEGDVPKWVPDPYSSNISAAWQVVEKLSDLFPTAIVEVWWGRHPVNDSKRAKCFLWSYGGHIAEVDTRAAPEAICKTALLAKLES